MINLFDFKTALLAKHAPTCCADPLSNRAVHFSSGIRPDRTVDQAAWPDGRSVLQPAGCSDFNISSLRQRHRCVAVPTRGSEIEGHIAAALGPCLHLERNDLACLVAACPRTPTGRSIVGLPTGD